MVANVYPVGSMIRLTVSFSASGSAADPTAVTLSVRSPLGVTSAASVARDGFGQYHADVMADRIGEWSYRWCGSGAVVATVEGRFLAEDAYGVGCG